MTSREFVRRIQVAVYESAISGSLSLLENPPGRRPSPALVRLSQWFGRLPSEDKERVRSTIQLAARSAVFGMLAVLDGDRSIRTTEEEPGSLELHYSRGDRSILLNHPEGEPLHDIFGALVPPE